MEDWMYSAMANSQIQLVSQRSNLLYSGKKSHKVRYQLSVSCYIQVCRLEQHLITHTELNINFVLIIKIFLPSLNLTKFTLVYLTTS